MASHGYAKSVKAGTAEPVAPKMPAPTHESMVHHIHIDGLDHTETRHGEDGMHHIQIHLKDGGSIEHNLPSNSESDKE